MQRVEGYVDRLSLLQQLGVVTVPGQASQVLALHFGASGRSAPGGACAVGGVPLAASSDTQE